MKDNNKTLDAYIGQKIRQRRNQLRLSQGDLGELLAVSAQQVQRYESGENSLVLGKLVHLAAALNVKPQFFLEQLPDGEPLDSYKDTISRGLSRPLRILLVDDDSNDALLFQAALGKLKQPVSLHHISKPEQVMDYLQRNPASYPDLAIVDINMPKVDGISLLTQIKTSAHKKLPVIMLTNSLRAKDMLACYEHHATGFIQKSAELHTFYADVEQIVSYWSGMVVLPSAA